MECLPPHICETNVCVCVCVCVGASLSHLSCRGWSRRTFPPSVSFLSSGHWNLFSEGLYACMFDIYTCKHFCREWKRAEETQKKSVLSNWPLWMDSPCLHCRCLMRRRTCRPEPLMMRGYVRGPGCPPPWESAGFSEPFDDLTGVLGTLSSGPQNSGKLIANASIDNFRLNVDFCLLVSGCCSLPSCGRKVRINQQLHVSTHRKESRQCLLSWYQNLLTVNSYWVFQNFPCDWDVLALRFHSVKIRHELC